MSKFTSKDATTVIQSSVSHFATRYFSTVLLNQLGFLLNRAARQPAEKPTQDAYQDKLAEAMGEDFAKPVRLDTEAICQGMAAAYVLSNRHANRPNPDTGRVDPRAADFITTPREHIMGNGNDFTLKNRETTLRAELKKLEMNGRPVNQEKALAALKDAVTAESQALLMPILDSFLRYVRECKNLENPELAEMAVDAYEDSGNLIVKEFESAARAYIERQQARAELGAFIRIDDVILEWAPIQVAKPTTVIQPDGTEVITGPGGTLRVDYA